MKPVRLLLLGTGNMAARHAMEFSAMPDCEVVAAVELVPERLATFLKAHQIAHGFASLDEAIAWGGFDAAANITPDAVHQATTMQLIAAGKHVFCEKPLAPSYGQALEMTEAIEAAGLINMVNLRYRGLAMMQEARRLVAAGEIGEVRHIDAAFLQSWLVGAHWGDWRTEERWLWRLSHAHGSKGALGDVGIHILDFATFVSGQNVSSVHCRLKSFAKAEGGRIGPYDLDANDSFVMSIAFDGGALGVVHASRWTTGYANAQKVGVYGTKGGLEVFFESEESSLRACLGEDVHTQTWQEVECPPVPSTYESFVAAVRTGENIEPGFRHAAELQHVLDLCFESDRSGTAVDVEREPARRGRCPIGWAKPSAGLER